MKVSVIELMAEFKFCRFLESREGIDRTIVICERLKRRSLINKARDSKHWFQSIKHLL